MYRVVYASKCSNDWHICREWYIIYKCNYLDLKSSLRSKILSEYSHRSVILLHKVVEKGLRVFAAIDLDYEARITGANNASQEQYDYRSSVIEFAYFT